MGLYIYKIHDLVSGGVYIGSTNCPSRRKTEHFSELKTNHHRNFLMQEDWNRHGGENFIFEVLEDISDKDPITEAPLIEEAWAHKFKDKSYNIGNFGKNTATSDICKDQQRESHVEFMRPVIKLDPQGHFIQQYSSIAEAARDLSLPHALLTTGLDHSRHRVTRKGFVLFYKEDYERILEDGTLQDYLPQDHRPGKNRMVVKLSLSGDLIKEYDSVTQAAENEGLDRSWIVDAIRHKDGKYKGFIWMYKIDYDKIVSTII